VRWLGQCSGPPDSAERLWDIGTGISRSRVSLR